MEDDTLNRLERAERPSAHVEPLDEWLTVEPVSEDHETRTGLIIPSSNEVPVRSGVVLAVGEEVQGVGPGDKVLFLKGRGHEVRLGGEPVVLVKRTDLLARYAD